MGWCYRFRGLRHGCWHLWRGFRHWQSGVCFACHGKEMVRD
jgi:hypothetical protein